MQKPSSEMADVPSEVIKADTIKVYGVALTTSILDTLGAKSFLQLMIDNDNNVVNIIKTTL